MWEGERVYFGGRRQLLTPDLPGFGCAPRQTRPSIPEMARAAAVFLDQQGVREPVVVGGLSMGGYVAFEFLRQFPPRVRALGLFSTRAAADTPESRIKRFKSAEEIRASGLQAFARAVLPNLVGSATLRTQPELLRRVTEIILANDPQGVADSLLAMADRRDSADLLADLSCPCLVVAGEEDSFIPVDQTRAMQARIPNSRLAVIPQAGHLVNLEQPAAFQKALEEFLEELQR